MIANNINQNPQAWLSIGQRVVLPADMYLPSTYENNEIIKFRTGTIVEQLCGGSLAVKFDGYKNVVDYSKNEACRFLKIH